MCATPMVDPSRRLHDFRERDWFFQPGDMARFIPVDRPEFDRIRASVEDGKFRYRQADVEFVPARWYDDPATTAAAIERTLDGA
jgi:urea carboxylase